MKFGKYLFDKFIEIVFVLFGYIIILMMLFAFKVPSEAIIGITIVMILSVILSGCSIQDGTFSVGAYRNDLDKARASEQHIYEQYDYWFTKEHGDIVSDFVIYNDTLNIVQFLIRRTINKKKQYKCRSIGAYPISFYLNSSNASGKYEWEDPDMFIRGFSWCIVDKTFNEEHDNYPAFEFNYRGQDLHLCYKLSQD